MAALATNKLKVEKDVSISYPTESEQESDQGDHDKDATSLLLFHCKSRYGLIELYRQKIVVKSHRQV